MLKKWLYLLGITLSFSVVLAAKADYPIIWSKQLKLTTLKAIPALLKSTHYIDAKVTYQKGKQQALATSCQDYFRLLKQGFYAEDNYEIAMQGFFVRSCDALRLLQHARPAKISYLRSFSLKKDYALLPVAMVFPELSAESPRPGTVLAVYPDTTIDDPKGATKNSVVLVSKKAGMRTAIEWLASGDFNHDGYDDRLLFVANYILGASFHSYQVYLIGRKTKNGPLQWLTPPLSRP